MIRQAFDNFMIEQTSDEILQLIGKFGQQWQKYTESAGKVKDRLDSVQREFDQLVGTRRRGLERPLQQLEELRVRRNLPVDGECSRPDLDNVRNWVRDAPHPLLVGSVARVDRTNIAAGR